MPILHLLPLLHTRRIVLASASPRRHELLAMLGLRFDVVPSTFAEDLDKSAFASPAEYVAETSRRKALEVAERQRTGGSEQTDLVISADTIVVKDGVILEKPRDAVHAKAMLRLLSGTSHAVFTAVTLADGTANSVAAFVECTTVTFGPLTEAELDAYIATGEPFDKAGGYGIQGLASQFVEGVHGCYFNVVGFPVHRFCRELAAWIEQGRLSESS